MERVVQESSRTASYGLRHEILSPMETLAQSVSTRAPTTTPAATIPLVCALAGNGTWLATWSLPRAISSATSQLAFSFPLRSAGGDCISPNAQTA